MTATEDNPSPAAAIGSRRYHCATVALDIGEQRGALVIYPDDRYQGLEVEISPADGGGPRVHTGVHERETQAGPVLTAIFGSLPAGQYVIWADGHTAGPTVLVLAGTVAEIRLG
jgi:hypothetical protein